MWWDYTWDNNNVTQATNKPHNFVNITGSYGNPNDVYFIKAVGFNNNYTGNKFVNNLHETFGPMGAYY